MADKPKLRVLVILAGAAFPSAALAQDSLRTLSTLERGREIHVVSSRTSVIGWFDSVTKDSIRLRPRCVELRCAEKAENASPVTSIGLNDLTSLSYRDGHNAHKGFMAGLAIGTGIALGLTLLHQETGEVTKSQVLGLSMVFFGGTGTLVGAIIGSTHPNWVTIRLKE